MNRKALVETSLWGQMGIHLNVLKLIEFYLVDFLEHSELHERNGN